VLPFELPPRPGSNERPVWTGSGFSIGDQTVPVLEYSENFEGWSDDLTSLHEEAAGDTHPIDQASRRDAIRQLKRFLQTESGSILEIGCSSGFLLRELRAAFPKATLVGADVVLDPLVRLAQQLPTIPLIRFDLLQNPLPKNSFDAVVMLNVLEHIEDDGGALFNVHELLKPGGVLVLEVPAGPRLYDAYDEELKHFRRYSAASLEKLIERARLRVVRRSHLGFLAFPGFLAVKLMNRWLAGRTDRNSLVRNQAATTSESRTLRWLFGMEERSLESFELPFGIRALFTAVRPDA
jgi:SAM-dependent methyltransferase